MARWNDGIDSFLSLLLRKKCCALTSTFLKSNEMNRNNRKLQRTIPANGRRSLYGRNNTCNRTSSAYKLPIGTLKSEEIESRCQVILVEIERCKNSNERYIESSVLHNVPQTFVPNELCSELEAELYQLLTEQILREERLAIKSPVAPNNDAIVEDLSTHTDPLLCLACNGHCAWTPFCDVDALAKRKKELYRELIHCEKTASNIVQSIVPRSSKHGGDTNHNRNELIQELSDEIKEIGLKLNLAQIDNELHKAYACSDKTVTVNSIHHIAQTLERRDGISALEYEHDRHIAQIVSVEVVDSILEWMLEGWYWGERDTKDKRQVKASSNHDQRGSVAERASRVQQISNHNALLEDKACNSTNDDLQRTSTNMKYSLFCLTFSYFRALHVIRKEKAALDGSEDLCSLRQGPSMTEEKKKMIEEEKNKEFRTNRIEYAVEKARVGEERKRQRIEKERVEKTKIRQWQNKQEKNVRLACLSLQRVWRGHLGRKVANERAWHKERIKHTEALRNDCATDIARIWRGYCGRIDAGYLRAEMANFLFAIRQEEARDEEEEYLATTNTLHRKIQLRK